MEKSRKTDADIPQRQPAAASPTARRRPGQAMAPSTHQLQIDGSARMQAQRVALDGAFDDPLQRRAEAPRNDTGMPDPLKAGLESLSGMDMSGVRVHRNSDKPAQLDALAYAQGDDIHLGPGQEQHLAHEAWHVVQQRQGRVQQTMQLAGVGVNDDVGLEREADAMGAAAASQASASAVQRQVVPAPAAAAEDVAQRLVRPVSDLSSLADIVEAMRLRCATSGAATMVEDFAKVKPGCEYWLATNDKEGAEARYGLMSIKRVPPPIIDAGHARTGDPDHVMGTLWVEGVVADDKSGLGAVLLNHAEQLAREAGCNLSLAAMEETFDDKPYSMAGYYAKRQMQYSGDALREEAEAGREVLHPIYVKNPNVAKL